MHMHAVKVELSQNVHFAYGLHGLQAFAILTADALYVYMSAL